MKPLHFAGYALGGLAGLLVALWGWKQLRPAGPRPAVVPAPKNAGIPQQIVAQVPGAGGTAADVLAYSAAAGNASLTLGNVVKLFRGDNAGEQAGAATPDNGEGTVSVDHYEGDGTEPDFSGSPVDYFGGADGT